MAKNIIDQMTGDAPRELPPHKNQPVELGRLGCLVLRIKLTHYRIC